MKKALCIFLIVIMLTLCACGSAGEDTTQATAESAVVSTCESPMTDVTTETIAIPETNPAETDLLPLPEETVEFSFLSGAGGWRTILTLNRDGSFMGMYLDSEMGEVGDGYPHGSVYICNFSGKFQNITKVDAYSYKMTLADIETEKAIGEEWIEDNIRYVASGPHGLNDPFNNQECTDFVFFLPDTPIDQVSEAFLSWWPHRFSQETEPRTTLSCYGILNVTTESGFFTAE